MNRICIARRRQKRIQEFDEKTDFISDTVTVSSPYAYRGDLAACSELDTLHRFIPADDTACEAGRFCKGTASANVDGSRCITMDVKGNEGTHIILKINFGGLSGNVLLNTEDVCAILQVSKSFVAKLVRTRMVQSCKVNRIRRFARDDILRYLTRNKRTAGS